MPFPYNEGDYALDSFEDITAKNLTWVARQLDFRTQILHGVIDGSDGSKISGSQGWTSEQSGTGTYVVTFNTAYSDFPTATFGAVTGAVTGLATPSQLDITTYALGGGAPADQSFSFRVEL